MITSTSNAQIKQIQRLMKKKRERDTLGLFLVEGIKMFLEAPMERLQSVYVSASFRKRHEDLLQEKLGDFPYTCVSDSVFAALSDTQTPQGVICAVRQVRCAQADLLCGGAGKRPLLLGLENLQDPGNLGTILRTAEGAGVTGILLSSDCVDIYNPKVIRSTMGSVYRIPFLYAEDFQAQIKDLQGQGITWYAAHLKGTGDYDAPDYLGPTGFLIGNESRGLSEACAGLADAYIRIPMAGRVESLNAAVAAALLVYEAARQRRGAPHA